MVTLYIPRFEKTSKLLRIEQSSSWWGFKRHVPFLKDTNMRRRITYLVTSTLDPFAADILYHKLCWTEHVLRNLNNQLEDSHLRNRYREIRQLQWLLSDCKVVVGDYGLEVGAVKSGYLKQLLTKEYGGRIGLKEPFQKNQNEMVYDVVYGLWSISNGCRICVVVYTQS